jgi:hypothetical protein
MIKSFNENNLFSARSDIMSKMNDNVNDNLDPNFSITRELENFNNAKVLTLSSTQKDLSIPINSMNQDSKMRDDEDT